MVGSGCGRRLARLGMVPALALALGAPAAAQYERPKQELSAAERDAIETNRRLAQPRPPTARPKLSPAEASRVAVFKAARNSVVFVSSITKKWFLEDSRTGNRYQVPPASGTGFVWDGLGHVVTNHHVITVEDPSEGPPGRGRGPAGDPGRRQNLQGGGDRPQPRPGHRRAARVRAPGAAAAPAPGHLPGPAGGPERPGHRQPLRPGPHPHHRGDLGPEAGHPHRLRHPHPGRGADRRRHQPRQLRRPAPGPRRAADRHEHRHPHHHRRQRRGRVRHPGGHPEPGRAHAGQQGPAAPAGTGPGHLPPRRHPGPGRQARHRRGLGHPRQPGRQGRVPGACRCGRAPRSRWSWAT